MSRLAVLALLLPLVACGQGSDGAVSLRVYAAASLTETFTVLANQFEESHPGTRIVLSLGPSSRLAQQISSGAPADVFAAASPSNMDPLVEDGVGLPGEHLDVVAEVGERLGQMADVHALAPDRRLAAVGQQRDAKWGVVRQPVRGHPDKYGRRAAVYARRQG